MKDKNENVAGTISQGGNTGPPSITIDYDLYLHHLEHSDLSDAQKKELLDTLWNIIVSFVDMGFGVHPLQQVLDIAPSHNKADSQSLSNLIHQYSKPTSKLDTPALAKSSDVFKANAQVTTNEERR